MRYRYVAGIDYSMTSPAMCVHSLEIPFTYTSCEIYYLTSQAKSVVSEEKLMGADFPLYRDDQDRFHKIAEYFLKHLPEDCLVFIEGYAFAAKGKVFKIAENTGVLKDRLFQKNYTIETVPPTKIKGFATGSGRASKEDIQETFIDETGVDFKEKFSQTLKQWNPSSDVIDAYYICKFGHQHALAN